MTINDNIIKNEQLLITAIKNSDLNVLEQLLHDDLIFTNQNGQVLTKEIDLEQHRTGNLVITDITVSEQIIRLFNDYTAVVAVKKHITGKYSGQAFEGVFRFTRVWKKLDSDWKVIAASSVPID